MAVVADSKKRVTIRLARPGDRFDVQVAGEGKFVLTRLEPVPEARRAKVKVEKSGKYSVGVLDQPIHEQALKEALSEMVTDYYLADLAASHGAKLATLDENVSHKAVDLIRL